MSTLAFDPADAVALTQELVRINTTNPPGNETPAVELIAGRLRAAGFETVTVPYPVGENRSHVVGRLRGTGGAPGLLFSGHIDVVPPGNVPWSVPPFGGEIRDGRLYGRGSADMKGGVAALVVAAEAIARSGRERRGDLVVAVTSDEERNCLGAERLLQEPLFEGIGAVLVAEPSDLKIHVAEKGVYWLQVTLLGKTAHGAMPGLGANAVSAMVEFLAAWEAGYPTDRPVHPLLGTPTLNLGTIQGGVKTNVVPDRCTATLDMRTVPGVEHGELRARAERLLAEIAGRRPGIRWEVEAVSDRPYVSCPTDSALAQALERAAREIAGTGLAPKGITFCTEACIWSPALGIPSVICGPGSTEMAHQPDEWTPVLQVEQAARMYARVAEELLG